MQFAVWFSCVVICLLGLSASAAQGPEPKGNVDPASIAEDQYVVVRDGHLYLEGQRVRFWGAIGNFPGRNQADNVAVVQRLKDMGFNMVRYWQGFSRPADYAPGDGSQADLVDHFLACLKAQGMYAWCAGLNSVGRAMPDDVGIVDEPATADAWRAAVGERGMDLRNNLARIWDPRLHALGIARMKAVADHRNRWTGLRWADDPVFATWELSNEEWWFRKMSHGAFHNLPEFFKQELLRGWNQFLRDKYGDEAKLRAAWLGLLPGEGLEKGSILLLPLKTDVEPRQQDTTFEQGDQSIVRQKYNADDFNATRGGDVIEFFTGLWIKHKRAEAEAFKSTGRSARLSPLVWDTGIGNEMQSQYLHQQADAVAQCNYLRGIHPDPTHQRHPWYSGLEEPPRLTPNREWLTLENTKIEGKPYFVYETQIHNPAKYRTEFPMRLVAAGAINDWDSICWHYFGPVPDSTLARPYEHALDYTPDTGHIQGLHYQYDEVQMSSMLAASYIFRQGLLEKAPKPTTFIFGRKSFYNMRMVNFGDKGELFLPTAYRYGMRMLIDLSREDDQIDGPTIRDRYYEPVPLKPTDQIAFDVHRGHLKFDAPAVAMYSGFLAQDADPNKVTFANGVVLSDVTIVNPPGMPYPVGPDEKYLTLCLVATDGQPLETSRRLLLSAMSTSFNTGIKLDHDKIRGELWFQNKGATISVGHMPVLVARVQATVTSPALNGLRYRMLDWHLKELATGTVGDGKLQIPADQPVFMVELMRGQ